MRKWEDALKLHKQTILDAGYKEEQLLGIFLYGSQNYGLATETSDIDTKAIYVPSLREMCLKNPISIEIDMNNGEHCELKDIRVMADMFKKQNINFLEILFTEKCWINTNFRDIWDTWFYNNGEKIAHFDMHKCNQSIVGQAIHTLKQIKFNDPKLDGKKYGNALRLFNFLEDFLFGKESFWKAVKIKEPIRSDILLWKTKGYMVGKNDVEILINQFENLKSFYLPSINVETGKLINDGVVEIIKKGLEINDKILYN